MSDRPEIPSDITEADLGFLHWWGPPTLYRCALESDPGAVDLALVGVPHSSGNGTTWRDQHLGPRSIRDVSMAYQRLPAEHSARTCEGRDMTGSYECAVKRPGQGSARRCE